MTVAKTYFYGNFLIHLIPVIPLHMVEWQVGESISPLYLIKIIRLNRSVKLFNVH